MVWPVVAAAASTTSITASTAKHLGRGEREAAAAATTGQTISHQLLRLLHKFAHHAEQGPERGRAEAESMLRRNVAQLITEWNLKDPNPGEYTAVLDGMVRQTPGGPGVMEEDRLDCEPALVLQIGLETDCGGPRVYAALETLVQTSRIPEAVGVLREAPSASAATANALWHHVATPARLRLELAVPCLDFSTIESLVSRLGAHAVDPLLDLLEQANDRSVRARTLHLLVAIGPPVAPVAAVRLKDAPWFVQRNLLALLRMLKVWPAGFSAVAYARHPDIRLRREAYKLLLEFPDHRASAIFHGLGDENPEIVTLVLRAAVDGCPPEALRAIEQLTGDRRRPAELRAIAVRALGRANGPHALAQLLDLAGTRRHFFGWQIEAKSPVVLAAVSELARNWGGHPQVIDLLKKASDHDDPEIRLAAQDAVRMSDPIRFLTSLSNALSTLGLYGETHPATRRAADAAYRELADLQVGRPGLIFTFMQEEVLFGRDLLPELEHWEWSARFAQGGIERLEISGAVSEPHFERFLGHAAAVLGLHGDARSDLWQDGPEGIRFGRVRVDDTGREPVRTDPLPVATLGYSLREEREAVSWVHQEVGDGKGIPLLEAYGVVRSLSLAMHGGQAMVMPLLQLKEFDQYTTTHSMNVSVLTMALGEFLGMAPSRGARLRPGGAAARPGQGPDPQGDPVQAGQAHARRTRRGRGPSRRRRPDDPRGQRAARSRGRRGLRAPPLPRRRRLSARPLPAGLPPGEPPGARLRRLRRPPHAPALPRRLVLDAGARLHQRARGGRVRPGHGRGVHRDDAAVGYPDRDRTAGLSTVSQRPAEPPARLPAGSGPRCRPRSAPRARGRSR